MHSKQKLLIRLTCFFWLVIKIAGYKIWVTEGRLYPVVPPFEFLDTMPPLLHTIVYILSLTGLIVLFIFPQKRIIAISTLILIVFSCSLDVLRWQPWEYQFLFFLLIFIVNHNNPKLFYNAIVFILASTYIYSGLHKINGGFLHNIWEHVLLSKLFMVSGNNIRYFKLHYIGLAIPAIEIAAGLGLLFIKKKLLPTIALITMHVFILILMIRLHVNFLSIIPQWNIAMIFFLGCYYYRDNFQFSFPSLFRGTNKLVFLCWGILPALSFTGHWDKFLSSSMYSGTMKYMAVCVKNTSPAPQLKPYFAAKNSHNICNGAARINVYGWALKDTGVLPYPEYWYYKRFKTSFKKLYPGINADFIVYKYPFKERVILE